MKTIKFSMDKGCSIEEQPEPSILEPDDIKIRMRYVGISSSNAGNALKQDIAFFQERSIGFEFSGEITELGSQAYEIGFSIGDRVSGLSYNYCGNCYYCRNGKENMCLNVVSSISTLSEYVIMKPKQICVLPDNVSLQVGTLFAAVSNGIHAVERSGLCIGDKVLVLGGGPFGQIIVQLAKLRGANQVILSEPIAAKRSFALQKGADFAIDPTSDNLLRITNKLTDSRGFNVIFDACNSAVPLQHCVNALARGGVIVMNSLRPKYENQILPISALCSKAGSIVFIHLPPFLMERTTEILHKLDLDGIIDKVFNADDISDALKTSSRGELLKILLKM